MARRLRAVCLWQREMCFWEPGQSPRRQADRRGPISRVRDGVQVKGARQLLVLHEAPVYIPSRGWGRVGARRGGREGAALCPGSDLLLSPQGKRYKNSLETVGTPDSGRGRSEKKAIK